MATTSRASFNHSCLKTPLNPVSRMPSPGYERRPGDVLRPLSSSLRATPSPARASGRSSRVNSAKASRASSASGPRSRVSSATVNRPTSGGGAEKQCGELLGPLLSFYESIPDYSELGHLSDREFYAKVHELRQTQRAYVSSLAAIEHQRKPGAQQERWTNGLQGVRCVLNDSRGNTPVPFLSPSSSARTGSPSWAKLAWGKVARARDEVLSSGPSSPVSSPRRAPRPSSSPLSSPRRNNRPLGPVLRRARPPGPVPGKTRRPRPASGQRASPERGRSVVVNLQGGTRTGSARRSRGGGGGSLWDCSLADDEWPGGGGSVSDGELRATPLPCALSDDSEDELLRMAAARGTASGQRHVQSRGKNVAWREPQFTVPHPFEMTRREEDARYYSHLRRELLGEDEAPPRVSRTPSPPRRCHDVPLTSRLPLFHGILLQQELRRERQKRHSKARLLSQVRPFSFDNADLSPPPPRRRLRRKLWQSSPELRELSRVRGGAGAADREFRATPMPHHLFSAETFLKRQEDDFLRMLRRRVRAEELLRDASLPPSMASRTLVSHSPCRPSTATLEHASSPPPQRRQHSAPLSKSSGSRRSRGLSPYDESPRRSRADRGECSPYEARANYEAAAWGKGASSRRPLSASASGSVSPIRHNLAAVLRIESCRRRAEREAAMQLEHRRQLEEARVRARVLRRRPAWRNMAHVSARRDLALRALSRREEERSRQQDHVRQMGSMMGRVLGIPTLFERQSQEGLRFRVQEQRDMRTRLDTSVSPRKSTACSPEAARTSKFVAPLETHISFYPGTRNGEEIGDEEKGDEPEFPASDKHEGGGEKTPRGAKSIKSPLSRQGSKDSQAASEGSRRASLARVQSRQDSTESQKGSKVSRQASRDKESAEECEEEFESEREGSTPCTERAV